MVEDDDALAALVLVVERMRADRDEDRAIVEELQMAVTRAVRPAVGERVYPDWVSWVEQWLTVRVSRRRSGSAGVTGTPSIRRSRTGSRRCGMRGKCNGLNRRIGWAGSATDSITSSR